MVTNVENKPYDHYVNLHTHSYGSLLDGLINPKQLVDYIQEIGQPASCITDHGYMFTVVEHCKYAESKGVKPLIGFEPYVVDDMNAKKTEEGENRRYHGIFWAVDNEGYKILSFLSSKGATEGFYYKPRIDFNLVKEAIQIYGKGHVIFSTACIGGKVPQLIENGDFEGAVKLVQELEEIFGKDYVYLEIQPTEIPAQVRVNEGLIRIHQILDTPLVATNDAHYLKKEHWKAHDALLALQTKKSLSDPDRWRFHGQTYYIMTRKEVTQAFLDIMPNIDMNILNHALDNTVKIAERCNANLEWNKPVLPKVEVPHSKEFDEWLNNFGRKIEFKDQKTGEIKVFDMINSTYEDLFMYYSCLQGLKEKNQINEQYINQLNYETSVIAGMGFSDYFLILADAVDFCHKNNISVGPGRGSAAGSLVTYSLDITTVDPIEYGLIFERFLNPKRKKMPDVDIDFCIKRRQEVFDYLMNKYGKSRFCRIATFGRLKAKSVIKDLSKAMDIPFDEVNTITKELPSPPGTSYTIKDYEDEFPQFKEWLDRYDYLSLREIAYTLEGIPRHVSVHAAGGAMSLDEIWNYIPIQKMKNEDAYLSQFDKDELANWLVKFDILGLSNLTELDDMKRLIKQFYNIDIELNTLPLNDKKTWDLISAGETLGVFQCSEPGMINLLRQVGPRNMEELSACNALVRPGASLNLPTYLDGRTKNGKFRVFHEDMRNILSRTYGALVYQEQIMMIVAQYTGCDFGQADIWRRNLEGLKTDEEGNKVIPDDMKNDFITQAVNNGYSKDIAEKILKWLVENAGYAFNIAHSMCYSFISYWTAYMKANFPLIFYAVKIDANLDSASSYILQAKGAGIQVLPPHINHSGKCFTPEGEDSIRASLTLIKGIGEKAIDEIIENRPFESIDDFFSRNNLRVVNKRVIEALIGSNCFEGLGIEINDSDVPESFRSNLNVVNNRLYLNRKQLAKWYDGVLDTKKAPDDIAFKNEIINEMKSEYNNFNEVVIESNEEFTVVLKEKADELGIKLSRKGRIKIERPTSNMSEFRQSIYKNRSELFKLVENKMDIYLNEINELGFSFITHPLEKMMHKIMSFKEAVDGQVLITAGIITGIERKTTKTKKPMAWVFIRTPREEVKVLLWENHLKVYNQQLIKGAALVVQGVKGFGGITADKLKFLELKSE